MKHNQAGQAVTEYALVTAVIAGMVTILFHMMPLVLTKLEAPLKQSFPMAYKNGDPKACGYTDETSPCSGAPDRFALDRSVANYRIFGRPH